MYRETQDHQMSLNDRYLTAGSQTRSAVEKSRAWLVGQVIYPNVDESRFAALFSDDKLILRDSYKSASIYISFLYLGALFQGFTTFITAGLLQGTKTGSIARSSSIGAAVNLGIDLVFMKFIGIQAASFSTFCGFFVMWICRMHDTRKITPVYLNKKKFVPLLVLAVGMATITIWTNNLSDLILTVGGIILFFVVNHKYIGTFMNRYLIRKA